MNSTENESTTQDLAQAERKEAGRFDLSTYGKLLLAAWILFVGALLLPHGGNVRGWHVLTFQAKSMGLKIGIAEVAFVLLGTLGVVVFGGLLLITKRTVFANISFLLCGMALFASLFGMWMRLQDRENTGGPGLGVGLLIEVFAVLFAVYALSFMVMRRSEAQQRIAEQRAQHDSLDAVGKAQQDVFGSRQYNQPETNPLLIDDRRKQAAQRHRKAQS